MQAVSQASSDKLSVIEEELRAAREETADVRAALDKAWASEKELKRSGTMHPMRPPRRATSVTAGACTHVHVHSPSLTLRPPTHPPTQGTRCARRRRT